MLFFIIFWSIFRIGGYLQPGICIDDYNLIMKKLAKRTFKGIEYIRLSSLPKQQAEALVKSLNPRTLVKIQMYEEIVEDCVLYEAYEVWFGSYQQEVAKEAASSVKKSVSLTW